MQYKPTAIVLGLCPTGLAAVRGLGRCGIPVKGVDSSCWSIGFFSKYCSKLTSIDYTNPKNKLIETLVKYGRTLTEKGVLFPTSDEFLVFIAKHNKRLSKYYRFPALNEDILDLFLNKRRFYQTCINEQVPCPKTFFPTKEDDLDSIGKQLKYPCIIKPIFSHIWARTFKAIKAIKINSINELYTVYRKLGTSKVQDNIMIQDLVEGDDDQIYVFASYFDKNSVPLAIFTGKKIRQYPPRFGTAALAESVKVQEIIDLSVRFLKGVKFHGLCGVEFKRDARDGKLKIMEVNQRVSRWYSLSERCNINLVHIAYLDLTARNKIKTYSQKEGYKWIFIWRDLFSSLYYIRKRKLSIRRWFYSLKGPKEYAIYTFDDPLPLFIFPLYLIRQLFYYILLQIKQRIQKIDQKLNLYMYSFAKRE